MHNGLHHLHLRRRAQGEPGLEPYPSQNPTKRFMDRMIYVIGVVGPLTAIPQMYDIWIKKNAGGVSVASWASFSIFNLFWLIYAVMHRERPLIITHVLWFIFNSMIAIGAFIYR